MNSQSIVISSLQVRNAKVVDQIRQCKIISFYSSGRARTSQGEVTSTSLLQQLSIIQAKMKLSDDHWRTLSRSLISKALIHTLTCQPSKEDQDQDWVNGKFSHNFLTQKHDFGAKIFGFSQLRARAGRSVCSD